MALEELSDAHAILLATHACAGGNVADLPVLQAQFPHCFPLERLLRIILTYLPESTEPSQYISVLQELVNSSSPRPDRPIDTDAVQNLTESVARKRVRKLELRPLLRRDEEDEVASADPLTQFLIHRAHLIDSETALQPLILKLIAPFSDHSPVIRTWLISSLLPLLRLNYEYYAHRDETISLEILESMDDQTAVNILLSLMSSEENNMDLINNLRGLVGPWLYGGNRSKRRRLNEAAQQSSVSFIEGSEKPQASELAGWEHVNEWLLSRSLVDRTSVVSAFNNWDGPSNVDLGGYDNADKQLSEERRKSLQVRYGQSGLAVVYAHTDSSKAVLDGSYQVLTRVAKLLDLDDSSYLGSDFELPSVHYDATSISSTSRASLMQNSLLRPSNPLTKPSPSSISFLSALLLSLRILTDLGHLVPCRVAANLCLHSTEDTQLAELKSLVDSTVKQAKSNRDWSVVRERLLWLRDWQTEHSDNAWGEPSPYHGLFWRIPRDVVETEILKMLLAVKEYQLAIDIYTESNSAPLQPTQVETAVRDAIFAAYNNASNGNRTRGGIKRAYDIIRRIQTDSCPNRRNTRTVILLPNLATRCPIPTRQHSRPPRPHHLNRKSPRAKPKELHQTRRPPLHRKKPRTRRPPFPNNNKRSLLLHLPHPKPTTEQALLTSSRRITSLAIVSALSSNDFGTAYSYILTRLTPLQPPHHLPPPNPIPHNNARRHNLARRLQRRPLPPPNTPPPTPNPPIPNQPPLAKNGTPLPIPHPHPLPEILGAWRRCDEELSSLRTREQAEEDLWDAKGDTLSSVPGGFGPTDSERDAFETEQQRAARRARARNALPSSTRHEAPMGLFEVARGAALALHKNAFPLSGGRGVSGEVAGGNDGGGGGAERPLSPDSERVRKRDVVSNMVTGGLVSGIGWVLGADPVGKK
ncbi:hypothetical protein N7535_000675 [Penicillium sp. DV-2018c]|nr:hypothetical protein N7535_000675 [Penicillium sp. DV-2018c]